MSSSHSIEDNGLPHFSNLDTILFDFDGTLINTHAVFVRYIDLMIDLLVEVSGRKHGYIKQLIFKTLRDSYKVVHVNPEKMWNLVHGEVVKSLGLDEEISLKLHEISNKIYTEIPEVFPDVHELLTLLKKKYRMGLVTHASESWTKLKLSGTELQSYFDFIHIVSTDKYKDESDWSQVATNYSLNLSSTLVVGDSIQGDIIAANKAGFNHLVLMTPASSWSVYKEGDVPLNVIAVKSMAELKALLYKVE